MRAHYHHLICHLLVCSLCLIYAAPQEPETHLNSDNTYDREIMKISKAAAIRSYMDESIDPCSDFYEFSCGRFIKFNPATTKGVVRTGLFEELSQSLARKLSHMLNSNKVDTHDTPEDVQVKRFYKSCMRLNELQGTKYEQKLRQLIAEFGKMPVLEGSAWKEAEFDWLETTARISYIYGIQLILRVEIFKDLADNQVNIPYVGPQEFPLETRAMYLEQSTEVYRNVYRDKMQRTLEQFLNVEKNLAKETAMELMDFEVNLAKGLIDDREGIQLSDMTELMTIGEMHKRYSPVLDIKRLLNVSLGEQFPGSIYEYNSRYQLNLVELIPRTPKRTVANYIFFGLINEFSETAAKSMKTQQKSCIDLTKKQFAKNLDNMIYRRHINSNVTSNEIELMWLQLKSTFNQTLSSSTLLDWIEPETRELAIKKLDAMTLQINSYVEVNFTEEFAGLQLQEEDYVENVRRIRMLKSKQLLQELHKPAKPLEAGTRLSFSPANVLVENVIKVPVALLQPYYLWSEVYPNAVMYGTLAWLIGHELIHGFDDDGRAFDARGNINDWWDEKSASNFLTRRRCFTEQYARYVYNGVKLKESTSQSENIADNGGIRLAYAAYRNWYEALQANPNNQHQLLEEKLPNLNFTGSQLFFISYAQIWCSDTHEKYREQQISTDMHMPEKFRVIGPLSNLDEFSKEFQCAVDSPMNPSNKCKIY